MGESLGINGNISKYGSTWNIITKGKWIASYDCGAREANEANVGWIVVIREANVENPG